MLMRLPFTVTSIPLAVSLCDRIRRDSVLFCQVCVARSWESGMQALYLLILRIP